MTTQREREGAGWVSSPGTTRKADEDEHKDRDVRAEAEADSGAGLGAPAETDETGETDVPDGRGDSGRRAGRFGGRSRTRAVLVAASVVLVAGGGFASVRALGSEGGRPDGGTASPRAGRAAVAPALEAWATRPAAKKKSAPQCSYGAGKLLCAQPGLVSALDPADGSVLWRHPLDGSGALGASEPPVVSGGLVQVLTDENRRALALDPGTGEVRWERDVSVYGGRHYAGGTLLLTATDGTVTGVDTATGDTRWSGRIPGQPEAYFTSFDGDRSAYLAYVTGEGAGALTRITAVDPASGDVRWDTRLKGRLELTGAADGAVFLTSIGGAYEDTVGVVRYDPGTGRTVRVALPVPLQQARGVVRGDVVYLLSGAGGALAAVDMKARRQVWRTETGVARGSAPVTDDRHLYFTASDGRLLAVDLRKGRISGDTPSRLGDPGRVTASLPEPVVVDGRVCAGALDGTVLGLDGSDPGSW
jgi:outer membrane protein assembly factor BamB